MKQRAWSQARVVQELMWRAWGCRAIARVLHEHQVDMCKTRCTMSEEGDLTEMRANDVASVFCARAGTTLTAMKLQKLLYYTQAWHLAVTDRPLFSDTMEAYQYGPVVPEVWRARWSWESRNPREQQIDSIQMDDLESDLIDLVLATYGSKTGDELSALTHEELPWLEARGDLPDDAKGNGPISEFTMANFYRSNHKLGGHTAADMAAGGIQVPSPSTAGAPVDIDALLRGLPDFESDDVWGGANLHAPVVSIGALSFEPRREAR
jgi:uncharacterized phage-associated protein